MSDLNSYPSQTKEKSFFKFLSTKKAIPALIDVDSVVPTPREMANLLEEIAKGLETRFSATLTNPAQVPVHGDDFDEVTASELAGFIRVLPNSAPGPDGITTSLIKTIHKVLPQGLLALVNHSVRNSWIPSDWRVAKIIPLFKKQGADP